MRDNIGEFIKEQRSKNNISQNKLAEILFVDRTLISKWENGKATPCMNEIIKMVDLFNISIEEFISAETYNLVNKDNIKNNFNNYLINQDNKIHKIKKFFNYSLITIILILLTFFIYYFYNTYNKTIVYRIGGVSDEYYFDNGILLLTRDNSYMKIGYFDLNIKEIEIYYEIDDKKVIIYKGEPNNIKIDNNEYNSSINIKNFKKIINNFYMIIYDIDENISTMKLDFKKDFMNNKLLFYYKYDSSSKTDFSDIESIPNYIRYNFACDNIFCTFYEDNYFIKYYIAYRTIYIEDDNYLFYFNLNKNTYSLKKISNGKHIVSINENKEIDIEKYLNLINKYISN